MAGEPLLEAFASHAAVLQRERREPTRVYKPRQGPRPRLTARPEAQTADHDIAGQHRHARNAEQVRGHGEAACGSSCDSAQVSFPFVGWAYDGSIVNHSNLHGA